MCRACLAATLVIAAALAGCGAERTIVPPDVEALEPEKLVRFSSPGGDVRLRYPGNWGRIRGAAPAVVHVFSGRAIATVWAYRRNAVPTRDEEMEEARQRLIQRARRRDKTFRVGSSRTFPLAGGTAIELTGRGTIGGSRVRIRSVHVFNDRGEYVVDAYATPGQFDRADRQVFRPLIDSLRVGGDPPGGSESD